MTSPSFCPVKFFPGQLVATQGALAAFAKTGEQPVTYLKRHLDGDWGDLEESDKQLNEKAIGGEDRILSAYHLSDDTRIWIVTEWDRSSTCILLPEEY